MRQWPFLCTAVLMGIAPPALALDPTRAISVHDIRSFGARDGLPQTHVTSLAQTEDGYLWVGTEGGLARYDGRTFHTLRPEDPGSVPLYSVGMLYVDATGDLWIGARGAHLARRRGGIFENFGRPTRRRFCGWDRKP